jgi:hypothetical protein
LRTAPEVAAAIHPRKWTLVDTIDPAGQPIAR